VTGLSSEPPPSDADRRTWTILLTIITVCFLIGIAFLVFAVWLDWD
jgi:hypothetical protein